MTDVEPIVQNITIFFPDTPARKKKVGVSELHQFHDTEEFALCPHYTAILDDTMDLGFNNMKWSAGFTIMHFAAKKNNLPLIKFLLDPAKNINADMHSIDDFGKKPIDYACPHKKNSVYPYLEAAMLVQRPKPSQMETDYQTVVKMYKHGKVPKGFHSHVLSEVLDEIEDRKNKNKAADIPIGIFENSNIADGADPPNKKVEQYMSTYEVEQVIPSEYKKGLKTVQGGWDNFKDKWPKGQTLLHWAARTGNDEVCKYCVFVLHASPNEECGAGKSAIDHARLKKHRKLAKALIKRFK